MPKGRPVAFLTALPKAVAQRRRSDKALEFARQSRSGCASACAYGSAEEPFKGVLIGTDESVPFLSIPNPTLRSPLPTRDCEPEIAAGDAAADGSR